MAPMAPSILLDPLTPAVPLVTPTPLVLSIPLFPRIPLVSLALSAAAWLRSGIARPYGTDLAEHKSDTMNTWLVPQGRLRRSPG